MIAIIKVLRMIKPKLIELTQPVQDDPPNATYCIFYYYNLKFVRFQLATLLVYLLYITSCWLMLGSDWYLYFFPEQQQHYFSVFDFWDLPLYFI